MRHIALTMLTTGLFAFASPAHAESRATYVTMVLQAFAAKVEWPGTDVAYEDLMQKAEQMQQAEGTTEAVRKAIAYMLTGGRMGERGDNELMNEIAIAVQSTDQDQKRLGMPVWCETQKTNLAGFIRTNN